MYCANKLPYVNVRHGLHGVQIIGMIETDSFFSFTHFENPQGDKERRHEFHTRELAEQLIFNELDGPREATPAGTRSKASVDSMFSAPYGTPRNTSTAPNTSATPECEKHVMRPISNLPGATAKHQGRCSVCKSRFTGRAPKVNKYCEACSDIDIGKLVFVCSRIEARSGGNICAIVASHITFDTP